MNRGAPAELRASEDSAIVARCGEDFLVFDGAIHDMPGRRGESDAAFLLSSIRQAGMDALHAVNGMFAFVFWESGRRRLVAARDRFGLKTLYWRSDGERIAVAPRIAPLLEVFGKRRALDRAAAIEFLVNGFTDQDEHTLFDGIQQLPPGCLLVVDAADGAPAVRRWYSLPRPESSPIDEKEAIDAFRATLESAVALRWPPSIRKGLMLSAGLDSSAIAGLIRHDASAPLRTYKANFGSREHDQRQHLARVVERIGAVHRQSNVRAADAFRFRERMLDALELPYERAIVCAHWKVCSQMASDGVKWTVDGVGADEQLGGYRGLQTSFAALQRGERPRGLAFVATSRPPESFVFDADLSSLYSWLAPGAREEAIDRIRTELEWEIGSFGEMCRHHMQRGPLPTLLRFNRELASAFGQQSVSPFLDHRLVELSMRLGDAHKIVHGRSKYVLRRAVEDVVPSEIVSHDDKRSYLEIEVAWLRGEGFDALRQDVRRTEEEWPDLFVHSVLSDPATLDKVTTLRLWRIACFGAWARRFGIVDELHPSP